MKGAGTEGEGTGAGFSDRDDPLAEAFRCAHLPMMIAEADGDNPVLYANEAFLALTGYALDEVVGQNCRFMQGPETDPAAIEQIRAGIAAERDIYVELVNYKKDGSRFWNALNISPIRTKGRPVRHLFASQSDITARKEHEFGLLSAANTLELAVEARTRDLTEALEQKTVLLHEVDHRVKNNLQLISALMLLQARRAEEPPVRLALERMLERLNAISTVHRRLFQSEDAAAFELADFLRDLAADLHGATGRDEIALDLALEPVSVPANQAASLALMVNEVVSNALRHAFPEGRAGRLSIALTHKASGFCICVQDDGVGRDGSKPGFGGTIVDLLGRQLKARVHYGDDPPGAAVRIEMPLSA